MFMSTKIYGSGILDLITKGRYRNAVNFLKQCFSLQQKTSFHSWNISFSTVNIYIPIFNTNILTEKGALALSISLLLLI